MSALDHSSHPVRSDDVRTATWSSSVRAQRQGSTVLFAQNIRVLLPVRVVRTTESSDRPGGARPTAASPARTEQQPVAPDGIGTDHRRSGARPRTGAPAGGLPTEARRGGGRDAVAVLHGHRSEPALLGMLTRALHESTLTRILSYCTADFAPRSG